MNISTPSVDLLPCPVCGKSAELHKTAEVTDEYPDSGCFVVFCQDIYCSGNCAPERSTPEEAISAWNERASNPEFRWYKSCCPSCGWSEFDLDTQHFLELSFWRKVLHWFKDFHKSFFKSNKNN